MKKMIICLGSLLLLLAGGCAGLRVQDQEKAYSLDFDPTDYEMKTVAFNGKTLEFRAYENIVYVARPVDMEYERMNIYIPAGYFKNATINGYTPDSAPIFFPNTVGGYMPGPPLTLGGPNRPGDHGPDMSSASLTALSNGLVVAAPGARGRTNVDKKGRFTGKAPACIVDLKAAVRYLRRNDKRMPGNAEKIISNGTSAGGALSALLGAAGNSADYTPYLADLGAAQERDDIFAASCYCPITNLDNADMAYEWLFNKVTHYKKMELKGMTDWHVERKEVQGNLTSDEIAMSGRLAALFPAYLNGLNLTDEKGTPLVLDPNGEGTFKAYVKTKVIASAQATLDQGTNLSELSWIKIKNRLVTDIDFNQYLSYITRMKTPPAFDSLDLSTGENELFGSEQINARHFTRFSLKNSTAGNQMAEAKVVKTMNPLNYIGASDADTAKHWRIRQGTADRDTSLAVPVILATTLSNQGFDVNFFLPWAVPHSGDYDLAELFTWIENLNCK